VSLVSMLRNIIILTCMAVSSMIELLQPNKTAQVLPFLNDTSKDCPLRFARVNVAEGPGYFSSLREYMVSNESMALLCYQG